MNAATALKLSDIKAIAASQKSAIELLAPGLERSILPELPDIKSHALVVTGIRRCGKSTLLRQFVRRLGKPYFYLNFDDLRLAGLSAGGYGLIDAGIAASAILWCRRRADPSAFKPAGI
jgi:hypothetical protein